MAAAPLPRLNSEIASALGRGAQVVTATVRAARALRRAFAEDARTRGEQSWQAPAITDWNSWLIDLYNELPGAPALLLNTLQEETLWKRVQAKDAENVVSPQALAQLARSGYALLSAYDAQASRRASWAAAHEDAERFLAWADAFDSLCTRLDVAPSSRIEERVRRHAESFVESRHPSLPGELLLLGFDRFTPAQSSLVGALQAAGTVATQAERPAAACRQEVFAAGDETEELRACALWIRARLAANPAARIGVLVPELQSARAAIDRTFRRVLISETGIGAAAAIVPYEFSLGTPLASVPLIAAALLLLRWLAGPLPSAEVTSLLTGGFLARDKRESLGLAQLDVELRRAGMLTAEVPVDRLLRYAGLRSSLVPGDLTLQLRAATLWQQRSAGNIRKSYTEWVEAAGEQLEVWGWPGFREIDSVAYQARERWESLLASIATLDAVSGPLRWAQFLGELESAAGQTLFAAESQDAPVQVLGATEASGLDFDAVWFMQLTEERWPGGGSTHPLLAAGVQRDAGMPHTSSKADFALAEEQLRRILSSAPHVVLSYARQVDGSEARMSPQLRTLTLTPLTIDTGAPQTLCAVVRETEPSSSAPWPGDQAVGSDALKLQSACGFKSFATRRLMAGELEEEAWGLDAAARGVLLHAALQELWSTEAVAAGSGRLHTQDDLRKAVQDGSIAEKLRNAIGRAFEEGMRQATGDSWMMRFLELEQQRLATRLRQWLEIEQQRAPFRVVGLEQQISNARIGRLQLRLRVDRIDEVAENKRLLLDYKTATDVTTKLWFGDRPEEPQLPVYALFGGVERVGGIAFAQIRSGGKTKLHAIAENPSAQVGDALKAAELHPYVLENWATVLERLAGGFLRGEAPVNPRKGEATCGYCSLHGVCRVRFQPEGPLEAGNDGDLDDA